MCEREKKLFKNAACGGVDDNKWDGGTGVSHMSDGWVWTRALVLVKWWLMRMCIVIRPQTSAGSSAFERKRTALQMCRITAGFNSDSCDKTGESPERDVKGVNDDLMRPQKEIRLMELKTKWTWSQYMNIVIEPWTITYKAFLNFTKWSQRNSTMGIFFTTLTTDMIMKESQNWLRRLVLSSRVTSTLHYTVQCEYNALWDEPYILNTIYTAYTVCLYKCRHTHNV